MSKIIEILEGVIKERKSDDSPNSYIAELNRKGLNKIAQKVGEEGVEVVIAALAERDVDLKNEAADLIFHLLILLERKGISFKDVEEILEERHKAKLNEEV